MFTALFLPLLAIAIAGAIRYFLKAPRREHRLSGAEAAIHRRLRIAGALILAAGLLGAGLAYKRALAEKDAGAIGYEVEGGTVVPIMPGESKRYDYQMETIGGKANVFAAEVAGLWHGRNLAYTLAALSVGGSLACFFLAHLQARVPQSDPR